MTYTRPAWAPTIDDVAAESPAYTREAIDGDGENAGARRRTFTADTDPSADVVEGYIDAGVKEVLGRIGTHAFGAEFYDDPDFLALASTTVKWHAAATVEAEAQPAGIEDVTGAYRWKQASYVACLTELIAQARRVRPAID